jgi:hypothetical protein
VGSLFRRQRKARASFIIFPPRMDLNRIISWLMVADSNYGANMGRKIFDLLLLFLCLSTCVGKNYEAEFP